MHDYDRMTLRNRDYIPPELQSAIRSTRLLIAGCGIGSTVAEAAVRLGFEHFVLVDGDVVEPHNLNRQAYTVSDIGSPKVAALAQRLRSINPGASITEVPDFLTPDNTRQWVSQADIVFDTIDFLDLEAILALHEFAAAQRKPLVTALAIGWGGGCLYFPPDGSVSLRELLGLPEERSTGYTEAFGAIVGRIGSRLAPEVASALQKALVIMEDGRPCPASQVAPGAYAVASLAATLLVRIVAGAPVRPAPHMVMCDMSAQLTADGLDLTP